MAHEASCCADGNPSATAGRIVLVVSLPRELCAGLRVLSPEILVVVYDLFFEFREWATDRYMAPSGGEHLVTAQIEGQILRVVSGELG